LRDFYLSIIRNSDNKQKKTLTSFWLIAWSFALSLGWLLPNHYLPWPSFHLEAWVAILLSGVAVAVLVRTPGKTSITGMALLGAAITLTPFAQYAVGMQPLIGSVWIITAYLLGFLLAMMVGARWESATPGQLADGLFLAIGIAAILSVGLQLHQWFGLDRLFLWDMGSTPARPFANFGQPNLLATFLLWGLLAAAWGLQRKYIGIGGALFLALYLLFGLALTGSRTAWIAVVLAVVAAWYWRGLWRSKLTPWWVMGLGGYFAACLYAKGWIRVLLQVGDIEHIARIESETRPLVWALFVDAIQQRPWFGYGWGQIARAHLEVAENHPPLNILFSHAHNIILDLILWCGLPLGLILCATLVWWLLRSFRAIKRPEEVLLLMFVVVVANHAMLEYPLSYAYLLLPLGLVIGVLDVRLAAPSWRVGGRWIMVCLWAISTLLLSLIIRDYSRVETSYLALRFEHANFQISAPKEPPDVLLLTQLREMIRYSRFEPHRGMSSDELDWMLSVANLYPGAGIVHKLAAALAWNGHPEESQLWLRRMCKMVPAEQCDAVRKAWANQALSDPDIRAVPWPATDKFGK
jgi:O-antigen ligase